MSTLTLDFTDSSFDDGLNNDGITDFVLSNNGGGLGVFAEGGSMGPSDAYAVDDNINVAAGISAMEITTNAGTEFTFEFLDEDDTGDRTSGDSYTSGAMQDGNEVFTVSMNEAFFADGLDITNGDSMRVDITEEGHSTPGTPITTVNSVDARTDTGYVGTLGHDGSDWAFYNSYTQTTTTGSWSTVESAMTSDMITNLRGHHATASINVALDAIANPDALLESMTTITGYTTGETFPDMEYSYLLGDEGGNGGETTWVISGDLNGRDATATDDSIGFRAGRYDGVFKGGEGFDTLVFSHSLEGDGQLFIDLSSGIGMFGNGQSSPLVQFADIGSASYELDWERLETEGSSNDFVIVGDGIGYANDNTGLTSSGSAIVDGFFEMSLGMGEDQVFVNDTSTGITLDLSGAEESSVYLSNNDGWMGEDASSQVEVDSYIGEDHGSLDMAGQGDGSVVDYIYAGDNNDLGVTTYGENSVVVNFGLHAAPGGEDSFGEDSFGEDSFGEDSFGEDSFGEDSFGEDSFGEDSFGEDSFGEDSFGEDSFGEDSFGEDSFGEDSFGEDSFGEDSFGEDSFGEDSFGEDSFGEDSFGEDSFGEDSFGEDSFGEDSFGEDSFGGEGRQPAAYSHDYGGEDSFGEDSFGEDSFGEDGVAYHGENSFESYGSNDAIDLRGMDSVEIYGDASDATILVRETVGAGEDSVEMTARISAEDVESIFVTQSGDDSDTDVLVDMSHLYGEDAGVLGQGVDDVSGGTYDVATSAHLDSFGSETSPMQIFYDGDHNAFVDSNDALTWTSSNTDIAHDVGVNDEQKGWEAAVTANDTGGAATPSFYVEISGQKVAVYLDQTDGEDVSWKVDTSAFAITSDASIYTGDGEDVIANLESAYGVSIDGEDLAAASNVYLNASESDIEALLGAGGGEDELGDVMSESAYDFGFYTQVKATKEGGGETFVNVALDYNMGSWSVDTDTTTRVQTDYNTVSNGDGSAAIGGTGSDFVELGSQDAGDTNIAMGNGGSDTYKVGSGDAGLINELGDLQLNFGGMGSDSDAVQFELVNSIDELTFTRTKVAGEKDGSTLQIDAGGDKGSATLFDQYNDFLDFRKTEFLVIDDGATRDEVFALVTDNNDSDDGMFSGLSIPYGHDGQSNSWDNEIYVAHANEAMTVDLGGTDYVFLGDDQANSVTVNIDQILMGEDSGSVTVSGIENDNLDVVSMMVSGEDIVTQYDSVKADADSASISWGENDAGDRVINIVVHDDDIDTDALLDVEFQI